MGKLYRDLVRTHSNVKGSARAVLNALADYANADGLAWPSRATLASDTGMSERNVIRCIQKLCADGHLSVQENAKGGRGRVPVYQILIAPEKGDIKGDKLPEERVTNAPEKGDNLSQKGDKCDAFQSHARSEPQEPNREPAASAPPECDVLGPKALIEDLRARRFMYFDPNASSIAAKLIAEYGWPRIMEAAEVMEKRNQEKIAGGKRAISAPLAYLQSMLNGEIDQAEARPNVFAGYQPGRSTNRGRNAAAAYMERKGMLNGRN